MKRNDVAAYFHKRMCNDSRFGYTQGSGRWGSGPVEEWVFDGVTGLFRIGDRDCSSSVIDCWQEALRGSSYEGALSGATYTGDMRSVFVGSGLFEWKPMSFIAQTGDIYLNESDHTAMCQSSVPDILSEFLINEHGTITGGAVGDQTGWESIVRGYYDFPWNGILHYNGKADSSPKQTPGDAVNDAGLVYRTHVQNLGWCDAVRDGQQAGTTGFGLRLEAIKIQPPEGWTLYAKVHVSNLGWLSFDGIRKGEPSGEGTSANDPIIGTVGKKQRIESMIIGVSEHPEGDDRKLQFQVHQAGTGWKAWTPEGCASGSDGMGIQLEAVRMKLE